MINEFKGKYRFLSNFFPSEVFLDGKSYPTIEHAYQAAKTHNSWERRQIRQAATASAAKKMGQTCSIHSNWEQEKIAVMSDLVSQKFVNHNELRKKLLATGKEELVEGNYWGDVYWGVCSDKGENNLGKILMTVRTNLLNIELEDQE